jgi:hypothetical protein
LTIPIHGSERRLQPPVHQASEHLDDSIHCTDRRRATQAGGAGSREAGRTNDP